MFQALTRLARIFANRPVLWFLLGSLAFGFLNLFVLPHTPVCLDGDGSVYLLNARRILEGQMIYRDFFQFTTPGTELVYLGLFRLLGVRAWIPNIALIFVGLSLTWLSIAISGKLVGSRAALLPGLLFLTVAFRSSLDATHHWYSALAVMAAVAVVIEKRSPARLAGAAALCALASCFTQARGVTAICGLAVFLLWEQRGAEQGWRWLLKAQACLWAAFLVTIVAANIYFVWMTGLGAFLNHTVVFGVRYWRADASWNTLQVLMTQFPRFLPWYRLPALGIYLFIHALFPLAYVLFFIRYRRVAHLLPWQTRGRLMLLNIMGLFLFIGVAPAPELMRLCAVSLPPLVLLVWLVNSAGTLNRVLRHSFFAVALILGIAEPWERQTHWRREMDLPVGRVVILNPLTYDKFDWLSQRTQPMQFILQAASANVYFPLGLRNPAEVPYITATDYTRPEQVRNVVESLENHRVRFVLWWVPLDLTTSAAAAGDHLGPLRAYLRGHYRLVKTFPDFEQVWERDEHCIEETERE